MKFKVQMKDPDVLHDSIQEAVENELKGQGVGVTAPDEVEALSEIRRDKVRALCAKWFRYGEYLTVEIDTDADTCVVCPARD